MSTPLDYQGYLPREGFHADSLGRVIRRTLLNPLLTIPLYAYFAYVPRGQQLTLENPALSKYSRFFAIWSALRVVNNFLERRSLNNRLRDEYNWSKEIVIVTGGSDGIGKRVVQALASKGIKIAVLDVQDLTYTAPPGVEFFKCDLTSENSVKDAAHQVRTKVGHPTILINNAGVCHGKSILDASEKDVDLTFQVNTLAHYRLAREFLPHIVEQNHGMVVTIASSAAWVTAPRMTDYCASKAAALSFHEGLTGELVNFYNAPKVRTVVVCQGYTRTALFQGFGVGKEFMGPALEVDTVAEAVVRKVLSGTSGHVVEPAVYNHFAANVRSFPWWMQDGFRKGLGHLMTGWNGRQVVQGQVEKAAGAGP